MGRCPYIDDSASFLDGYHCKMIGGKVDEYEITRCYCNSSASYPYCPHAGGDDRLRRKPEPEEPKKEIRRTEEPEPPDPPRQDLRKPAPSRSHSERHTGRLVLIAAGIIGIFVLLLKLAGYLDTNVYFNLTNIGTTSRKDYSVEIISRGPEDLFQTRRKGFNKQNKVRFPVKTGDHDFWVIYDDCASFYGTWSGNNPGGDVQGTVDADALRLGMERGLLITLQDGKKQPILTQSLSVTGDSGEVYPTISLGSGQYVILVPETAVAPALTFQAEGYEILTVTLDLSGRLNSAVVTLRNS